MRKQSAFVRFAAVALIAVAASACDAPWTSHDSKSKLPITSYQCWRPLEVKNTDTFYGVVDANRPTGDTKVSVDDWRKFVEDANAMQTNDINEVKATGDKVFIKIPKPCPDPGNRKLGEPVGPGDTPSLTPPTTAPNK